MKENWKGISSNTVITWFEDKDEEEKLCDYLQNHDFNCIRCEGKKHFDELAESVVFPNSILVIDLEIKETDAILACNEIKNKNRINTPFVIIIGHKPEEYTHVTALDLGADDYIVKPYLLQLFLKRIQALSRRKNMGLEKRNDNGSDFYIDSERHVVVMNETTFELPKKEFELLKLFYSVPNKIFTREEIAVLLWKEESIARQRTIDVHIRNIRKTLGKDLIKTVKGFGYGLNRQALN